MSKYLVALIILLASTANASGEKDFFYLGDSSCGSWTKNKSNVEMMYIYQSWARGFISGANWMRSAQIRDIPDSETISLYIDRYCKDNPLNGWPSAVVALSKELSPQMPLEDAPWPASEQSVPEEQPKSKKSEKHG